MSHSLHRGNAVHLFGRVQLCGNLVRCKAVLQVRLPPFDQGRLCTSGGQERSVVCCRQTRLESGVAYQSAGVLCWREVDLRNR